MDMSQFVKDWKVGEPAPQASLTCPSDKPVTMEIKISGAEPPERGKILIAQGISEGEELWAVRMNNSGRLFLYLGTAGFRETLQAVARLPRLRETEEGHYPDFNLGISYSPDTGAISLTVRDIPGRAGELLTGHAQNQWVTHSARHGKAPREAWQLCLGCPLDGRADQPPIGWTISASFRFGEAPSTGALVIPHYKEDRAAFPRDRIYHLAAEGADHRELSAEWHLGVLAGARAMGWKGGAA